MRYREICRIVGCAAAALVAAPVSAQVDDAPLRLSGNSRLRVETIDNQPRPGVDRGETLVSLRSVLSADFGNGPITIGGEIHDSRVLAVARGSAVSNNDVNAVEPVQAWVKADLGDWLGQGTGARLQAGRFTLNIASRRLVSSDEYRNATSGYTGLRGDLSVPGGIAATAFYVLPQIRLPEASPSLRRNPVVLDRESLDLRLWGATIAKSRAIAGADVDLTYVRLDERDSAGRATRDRRLDTVGARLVRAPAARRLDYDVEGAAQRGTISSATGAGAAQQRVRAWFAHGEIGYGLAGPWGLRVAIEYDHASGDTPGGGFGRFDTLFGMRRDDFGPAGIYSAIGRANIITPGVRLEAKRGDRIDGFIGYRDLWLASRFDSFSTTSVRDATGRSGTHAGRQIDARARWWVVPKALQLEANGTVLLKGRFLRSAPNAPAGGATRYLAISARAFF